jgi:hypothetical protein
MIEKSLVNLLFVIGRQLQLLLHDERNTDPFLFSVFLSTLLQLIYNHITVSNLVTIYLIYIYFSYSLLL